MADVGWITGHSYIVYGPLSNGVTTVMFESVPTYPTPSRYWQLVEKHGVNFFPRIRTTFFPHQHLFKIPCFFVGV
jgi:acyl-coenzyme A synthetase/AMP-(fatty) acid ligase